MVAPPTAPRALGRPVVLLGIVLNAIAAFVFGGLYLLGEPPPLRAVVWPGAIALTVAYALPAALAAVALRSQRPAALFGAGLIGVPLALTAMSGVSLILVVPTVCYLVGYATWTPQPRLRTGAAARILATVATGTAAMLLLFVTPIDRSLAYCYSWSEDVAGHRTYSQARPDDSSDPGQQSGSPGPDVRAAGSGCASDVITPAEAALGLGAAVVALAATRRLPRSPATLASPA
jgi:hypothetical protein